MPMHKFLPVAMQISCDAVTQYALIKLYMHVHVSESGQCACLFARAHAHTTYYWGLSCELKGPFAHCRGQYNFRTIKA